MADEIRRSGRATKGQHTKDREATDDAPKKGKGRGKKSAKLELEEEEEEEEDEKIRCVCEKYEEEEDNPRSMICCDNCSAWQHNDCMGLPEDYAPDSYFCEQCRPQDHKKLLAAMARGEKPWEEVARLRELAEAEKALKKKGKRGRKPGGRASEALATPVPAPAPTEEVISNKKRKLEESPVQDSNPKKARATPADDTNGTRSTPSVRKASQTPHRQASQSEPGSSPVVADIKELSNTARQGAASTLIKLFTDQTKTAVKQGSFALSSGTTAQVLGTQIGLQLENAMFHVHADAGEPNETYKNQLRSIIFNVKKNAMLGVRVMNGDLSSKELATMDAKDMASEEQQKKDAAMKEELEKQHLIIEEQGPRIRRTHKGDEYVDESQQVAAESATSNAPVRRQSTMDQDAEMKSPTGVATAERRGKNHLSIKSKGKPMMDSRRKSSNFDIDKVWSGVQGSPDAETTRFPDMPHRGSPPPSGAAGADPEIDNLLKDEDGDSEPYSPKEFNDDGIVWRGVINGGSLGRFHTSAKFAAGAVPEADTLRMTWSQVIPPEVVIHGRIQPSKADDYLCGLEYSHTSDLIIVSMSEPKSQHESEQFEKFFKYLKVKERYGVGIQHENPAIKDIYLLPMEAGQALPTFMKALEHNFPDPVPDRQLLVPIVIKNSELPHNVERMRQEGLVMSPSVGPPVVQTPITPHETPSFTNSVPYSLNSQPVPAVNGNMQSQQSPSLAQYSTPPTLYSGLPGTQPSAAATTAHRVLGPSLALAPAVQQLIAQAPTAGDNEFNIVKECISENPEAANRLDVLTEMLQTRYASKSQAQSQAVAPNAA